MSDIINKLHRYMRIGLNRNGQFPSENELIEKLDLSIEDFKELLIDAKESGRDIRPEAFELNQYSKIDFFEIEFGTEEKEPFSYNDFIFYSTALNELILNLDFSDDQKTENILEFAGTIVNFLEILIKNIIKQEQISNRNKNNTEDNYEKVMSVYGENTYIKIQSKELQISIDKFLNPFKGIFNKIGIIYESYDSLISEPFNEQNIIDEYIALDFNEIRSIIKLYFDDQLVF